ncbi:MAG: hypothetical protein ACYTBV_14945, partial [Planctomycetota bacterium]
MMDSFTLRCAITLSLLGIVTFGFVAETSNAQDMPSVDLSTGFIGTITSVKKAETVHVKEGFIARLPNGSSIELLAVSNLQWQLTWEDEKGIESKDGWKPEYWWKPD